MKPYLALAKTELKLALRDRQVIFFNYLFPLIFFFFFAGMMHADRGGAGTITMIVTNVLTIGILGNGLFGAGLRPVQDREANILRRYKVTPITPTPLLVSSVVNGLVMYLPAVLLLFALARGMYGMPLPDRPLSVLLFLAVGVAAFRGIGLIVAAVANSSAESNLLVQLLYMPMMFLSGAMFPASMLPRWAQQVGQFLPATYLVNGIHSLITRHEPLGANLEAMGALLLTLAIAIFIATRLFRWEKDEKLKPAAKLWVAGALAPFLALGLYYSRSDEQIANNRVLFRRLARSDAFLVRDAKIVVGDGRVIDTGSVLVRNGRIERVYDGQAPDASALKAEIIEGSGKTVLPGLVDVHVHLGSPAGVYTDPKDYAADYTPARALAQYLYAGVTTVRSVGDLLDQSLELRRRTATGDLQGAELFASGPLFTTADGHGTEYFRNMPANLRATYEAQFVRTPKTVEDAREQVRALKAAGADSLKAVLETGRTGMLFERMDSTIFRAVLDEATRQGLPASVHTGGARDMTDAVDAGASSVEHGSFSEPIPDALLARMASQGVAYDPTLAVLEAAHDFAAGRLDLLRRPLVQQVVTQKLLSGTRDALASRTFASEATASGVAGAQKIAASNLVRAWKAGVPLVTGSDAGNALVFHGPTIQRELALWVEAGIPPSVALQAATHNAARLLRAGSRIGLVVPGYDATLLVVDGDPTRDISAAERISTVIFKGERVRRADLFDGNKNPVR